MTLIVHDVRLAEGGRALDVRLEDGLIANISPAGKPAAHGASTEIVDGGGGTLVPGLIDAHFHAYGVEIENLAINAHQLSYVGIKGAVRCRSALQRGFTTVRDVAGGDPGLALALRQRVLPGPEYFYTGPALSQTGGHGDEHPGTLDLCSGHGHMGEVVDGVDALRVAVRRRFRAGAHAIKVMASGGVVSPTDPIRLSQYSEEELRAVCDEAGRRDSYVAAHAYPAQAVRRAVAAGVRSIEHGNLIDRAAAEEMAEAGAFLVPTLVAYDAMRRRGSGSGLSPQGLQKNDEVLVRGQEAVQLAHRAGARVGWGSDLMGDLEDEQLVGLELQAQASGFQETLRSATEVNAECMGLADRGRVAVGLRADLLILPGSLAEDPALLWTTRPGRTVIQNGRVVARDGRLVD